MSFGDWLHQLDFTYVLNVLISALAALICITVHESAHGLAASWLGDKTAKNAGRITLNPLKHVDLVGLIMLAVAHVGWAKPVPINMRNFKHQKLGMAITAFAGPFANLLLAFLALTAYYFCIRLPDTAAAGYLIQFVLNLALINCGLAAFNFIPIPPLDGSKVVLSLLPQNLYEAVLRVERYGMFLLIILVFFGAIGGILDTSISWIANTMWRAVCAIFSLFS